MPTAAPPQVRLFSSGPADLAYRLRAAWPEATIHEESGEAADALLVWDADPTALAAQLAAQRGRWWLHTTASGVPEGILAAARRDGAVVTNGVGTHGAAVAEHVVALLLAHYRGLERLAEAQRRRRWAPAPVGELRGRTVGLLGLGDLGRSTARLLGAFDVTVLGLRDRPGDVPEVAHTYRWTELDAFLAQLDALVIAVPLTDRTRGLVGRDELSRLRPGAYVVNVGRGPVLDGGALIDAVTSGHLAGAALDVFDDEPLPEASPLWTVPGVTITPHCGDTTPQTDRRCLDLLLDNVARHRSGRSLRNVVNLDRGY